MELNFSFIDLLKAIDREPIFMVMWAAFGVFFTIFLLMIPMYIFRKLGVSAYFKTGFGILIGTILISWIIGFISQIILLFSDVSGIRMLLIWIIMFVTYLVFCVFNKKAILKWVNEHSPVK